MELSGRSSSERLDNQREILTNEGKRGWRTTKLGWWSQSGCLPISELGTWRTWQKFHWSLKNRVSVCPSLGVLLDMAQYLSIILILAGWGNMDKINQKRSAGGFPNLGGKNVKPRQSTKRFYFDSKSPTYCVLATPFSSHFLSPWNTWRYLMGNRSTTFHRVLGKVDIWIYPAW